MIPVFTHSQSLRAQRDLVGRVCSLHGRTSARAVTVRAEQTGKVRMVLFPLQFASVASSAEQGR
jgi:hypothetical protein